MSSQFFILLGDPSPETVKEEIFRKVSMVAQACRVKEVPEVKKGVNSFNFFGVGEGPGWGWFRTWKYIEKALPLCYLGDVDLTRMIRTGADRRSRSKTGAKRSPLFARNKAQKRFTSSHSHDMTHFRAKVSIWKRIHQNYLRKWKVFHASKRAIHGEIEIVKDKEKEENYFGHTSPETGGKSGLIFLVYRVALSKKDSSLKWRPRPEYAIPRSFQGSLKR